MASTKFIGYRIAAQSCQGEIALKLKNIKYEYVEDPNADFPVLLHDNKKIAFSDVIVEYVEEKWKALLPRLLPTDAYDRAHDRAHARFISMFVHRMVVPAFETAINNRENEQLAAHASNLLKDLEGNLNGKTFFGGDSIGFADISACYIGYWVGILQEVTGTKILTDSTHPILHKWCRDFVSNPSVKAVLPSHDNLKSFYQRMLNVNSTGNYIMPMR